MIVNLNSRSFNLGLQIYVPKAKGVTYKQRAQYETSAKHQEVFSYIILSESGKLI
jgi:hypothetical protein